MPTPVPPRTYRATLSGVAVNAFGNGLMTPYVISWLAALPHGSTRVAGILFGATGAGQLIATLYAGRLLTLVPPRKVLAGALSLSALAALLLTLAGGLPAAAVLLFLLGSAQGIASAAQAAVLGSLTLAGGREDRVWSHLQVVLNLGQGLGFLAGGYMVTGNLADTMRPVFLVNAATFALFAAVVYVVLPRHSPAAPGTREDATGSYREVLRQPHPRRLLIADGIYFTFGIGFLLLLPLLASEARLLSLRQVAVLLAANTVIIICLQLPVSRVAGRLNRPTAVRVFFLGASAAWLLLVVGLQLGSRTAALVIAWAAVFLFSLTECLHTACLVPQLPEAVSETNRPRILALHVFASKTGLIAGPALGGVLMGYGVEWAWVSAACLLTVPALFPPGRRPATASKRPSGAAAPVSDESVSGPARRAPSSSGE
ncbi:MFS transporter [Streptomyces sp. NPDC059389]|uniref:MFS transporter n=1 Tax=Streptomyces sp. NPDC059389 TaxID=3346818 RepID=UPI0036844F60